MPRTTNAVAILRSRLCKNETPTRAEERQSRVDRYYTDMLVGQAIYDLREAAGLTQAELARLLDTSPSTISRLEDADYHGHSLSMLRRVADALGKRIEFRFVDKGSGAAEEEEPLAAAR
jgi:ribosome-binding protein aMBF1 (putative translation factor)